MINDKTQAAIVEIVRDVARTEILPHFRNLDRSAIDSKSAPDDLVTSADRAAEAEITNRLREILPDAAIIGEEAVSEDKSLLNHISEAEICVIIDPIDGTWNYAHGIANYGVILAVVENGETTFGMLYDPSFDDWVWGVRGHGAHYTKSDGSTRRLRIEAAPESLDEAFGFIGLYLYNRDNQAIIAKELPRFRRTTTLRASCHEYRHLALGSAAFGLNGMLNAWDHAAGVLIYQEAGGVARLLDGRSYRPSMTEGRLLNAQSEDLWSELRDVFGELI